MRRTSPPTLATILASASASRVAVPLYMASISPRTGLATSTGIEASAVALASLPSVLLSAATPFSEQAEIASASASTAARKKLFAMSVPFVCVMTTQTPSWLRLGTDSRENWCCSQLQHHFCLTGCAVETLSRALWPRYAQCAPATNESGVHQ